MWKALVAIALVAPALGAPVDVSPRQAPALPPQFAVLDTPTADPVGPPESSGSLRGSESLAGYNSDYTIDKNLLGTVPKDQFTVTPEQEADSDLGLYLDLSNVENPQPIRGTGFAPTIAGPTNKELDRQNSDLFAPPDTDAGDVPNSKWPMSLSHNRHGSVPSAGWARQQNKDVLPVATDMAGVDMHLEPWALREMHWHQTNEWSMILNGSVRISAVDEVGRTFTDDLEAGDVWFFPAGVPHSIQALGQGTEFLLIFDSGEFSEDGTSLLSELAQRIPKSVLAKNFQTDVSAFDHIPTGQLYIFPGTPAPANISEQNVTGPAGALPQDRAYSYHFSKQAPYEVPGGSVKILDSQNFPISKDFAVGLFTIKPGAMRELHWHTTSDEWAFIISGQGRLTAYSAPASSRTFDFSAGDCGYVTATLAHYFENTGTEDLVYLEVLQAPVYNDISVAQWLGLTPKAVVKDHLGFSEETLDRLPKIKPYILPGNPNLMTTNFTTEAV